MTPLAAHLAKQLVCRPKHKDPYWAAEESIAGLRAALKDIHCFEVTACLDLALDVADCVDRNEEATTAQERIETVGERIFLPAPKTWIEYVEPSGIRLGFLLHEHDGRISVLYFTDGYMKALGTIQNNSAEVRVFPGDEVVSDDDAYSSLVHLQLLLVVINSPKIVARSERGPSFGLQKRFRDAPGGAPFKLQDWTEIKLQITKPRDIDDGEPHEDQITGRRALHFCRRHIRIKNGRLEYVRAHWRGDPTVGIKQSRYVVGA
jgi:hypothetical protein